MVPAAINTYLREYQREGVQFFWDLYDEGRGGLLGDDMGLVCVKSLASAPSSEISLHYFDCRVSAHYIVRQSIQRLSRGMTL